MRKLVNLKLTDIVHLHKPDQMVTSKITKRPKRSKKGQKGQKGPKRPKHQKKLQILKF